MDEKLKFWRESTVKALTLGATILLVEIGWLMGSKESTLDLASPDIGFRSWVFVVSFLFMWYRWFILMNYLKQRLEEFDADDVLLKPSFAKWRARSISGCGAFFTILAGADDVVLRLLGWQ